LAYSGYNFKVVFPYIKRVTGKLLPVLLLICSIAYGQNKPVSKVKRPVAKPKPAVVKEKKDTIASVTTIVPPDSIPVNTEPEFDPMDTVHLKRSSNALKSSVKYTARDTIVYSADQKVVYLYGDAKVFYEDLTVTADFIKIELDKSLVTATYTTDTAGKMVGVPKFKQGQQDYNAQVIKYNYKTRKAFVSEFRTKEGEGYVKGTNVIKNEYNEFGIKDAYYTTCDADTPHFYISAYKLKVIPEKKVVGLWPNLVIETVNTPLVFPFGIFPIKKGQSSGLIIPQYGSDANRGFFLRAGGYYFGLGDHADLQLTGDIYSNKSWGGHSVFRYANRYRFGGNLVFNYNKNQYGLPEDVGYYEQNGFQLTWLHNQDPKARPGTMFTANVNLVSSTYLANNSYNPQNIITNQMVSSIAFSKSMGGGKYNFSTSASESQNTLTRDINVSFPNVTFTVSSFNPLKSKYKPVADKWYENISTNYMFQFRNDFTSKDSLLFKSRTATEFNDYYDTTGRFGVLHTLPVQTSFKLFKFYTLSARVDMNEYWYFKTIRKESDGEGNVTTRTYDGFQRAFTYRPSVSVNTRWYGMKQFKNGKISAIRHVVIPTAGVSYSPDYSESSYGYYKTYKDVNGKDVTYSIFERGIFGSPGNVKQGNIDFSLDNNLEMKMWRGKDTARKEEKIQIFETLKGAGSYNVFADSLNLSPISFSARTRLFKNVMLNGSTSMDPYVNVIDDVDGFKSVRRINTFQLSEGGLGTLTTGQVGLTASFNQDVLKKKVSNDKEGYAGELKYINDFPGEYADFNVPWTLTVNYTIGYNKYAYLNPGQNNFVQTLNYSGDFNLTKKWKIGYSSGWDFRAKQVTFTSINLTRDLHCWEFKFDWIPFGYRQSFLFTIHVKASILQELKQTRRREWYDRTI
jgi:hypothetical protein